MIREVMHDPVFLARKSEEATKADAQVATDLLDTLMANADKCVGMGANMIGELKRIIAVNDNGRYFIMYNPSIIDHGPSFVAEEGCLSLSGVRSCTRFRSIRVRYQDAKFRWKEKDYAGWTAQIIQHEIDHCNGILI